MSTIFLNIFIQENANIHFCKNTIRIYFPSILFTNLSKSEFIVFIIRISYRENLDNYIFFLPKSLIFSKPIPNARFCQNIFSAFAFFNLFTQICHCNTHKLKIFYSQVSPNLLCKIAMS